MSRYVHPLVRLCNEHGSPARLETDSAGHYVIRYAVKFGPSWLIETCPATLESVRTALGY